MPSHASTFWDKLNVLEKSAVCSEAFTSQSCALKDWIELTPFEQEEINAAVGKLETKSEIMKSLEDKIG